VKCLEKKNQSKYRGWEGKVRVAKAVGILILYIGKIRFVINRPGKGKRITEKRKESH
jgi:hypothetical protein